MLIFLDFDGVLHPFFPLPGLSDAENAHFSSVRGFEQAIRRSPEPIEIVIASTWRNKENLFELRSHFARDIASKIIGVTPRVGSGSGPGARQREVEAWLEANNRQGEPWIGVDDYPELYDAGATVVCCHDKFDDRETALLLEAVADPVAYAEKYPVTHSTEKKIVIVPAAAGR
jgi:hypothetical protein